MNTPIDPACLLLIGQIYQDDFRDSVYSHVSGNQRAMIEEDDEAIREKMRWLIPLLALGPTLARRRLVRLRASCPAFAPPPLPARYEVRSAA